jgi:hypothetical protein
VIDMPKHDRGAQRRLDFVCAAVLAILCLVALVWVIPANVPGEATRGEVAPSFFPNLTAGVVLVCSLAMIVDNRGALFERANSGGWRILGELAGWCVVAAAIWLLLAHIGFVAASMLATAVGTATARYRRRLWLVAAGAIALPFALHYAVLALFGIALP